DTQFFWQILAQLFDDIRYRPDNQPFTSDNLPTIFGEIFERLSRLALGDTLNLSDCGPLRRQIPRILPLHPTQDPFYRFRSVLIRRGAGFPGNPARSDATRCSDVGERNTPFLVSVVPREH